MQKFEIIAEQNSPSDEKIIVHEVLVTVGEIVRKEQTLFVAEGAKSLFDIVSPADGKILSIQINSGEYCDIGQVLAILENE